MAKEVPAKSLHSLLATNPRSIGTTPDRTARVQLPWNCTSSASELSKWCDATLSGPEITLINAWTVPATPNLALFLSSMERLQTREAASLLDSGELGDRIMELRWWMVSMSARGLLRSGLRERLKRMESDRAWRTRESDSASLRKAGIAPSA